MSAAPLQLNGYKGPIPHVLNASFVTSFPVFSPTVSCMRERTMSSHEMPVQNLPGVVTFNIPGKGYNLTDSGLVLRVLCEHDAFHTYKALPEMGLPVQAAHYPSPHMLRIFRFS
jgi:hypothetical protein